MDYAVFPGSEPIPVFQVVQGFTVTLKRGFRFHQDESVDGIIEFSKPALQQIQLIAEEE